MISQAAEDIYQDALDLPPEDRPAYVAKACAGEAELESEVLELLNIVADNPYLLDPIWPESRESPSRLGKYELVEEIGRGAMGRVFLARDTKLPRNVAIKILPNHLANPQGIERLHREAEILARLDHPRIATIYDVDEDAGTHFIAMQFVAGHTLAVHLQNGPLPIRDALRISFQIAEALHGAHKSGVIHRDLKPLNVMITEDCDVRVLDFGIAKVKELPLSIQTNDPVGSAHVETEASAFMGTPGYMSPEQLARKKIDGRADLWALGCILYECLTGRETFSKDPLNPVRSYPEPDWRSLPSGLPPAILRLLKSCLAIDPDQRPSSAEDVRAVLAKALGGYQTWTRWAPLGYVGGALLVLTVLPIVLWPHILSGILGPGPAPDVGPLVDIVFAGSEPQWALLARDARKRPIWELSRINGELVGTPSRHLQTSNAPAILTVSPDSAIVMVCTRNTIGSDHIHAIHAQTGRILWSRSSHAQMPTDKHAGLWRAAWQDVYHLGNGREALFLVCWFEDRHSPTALEFTRADGSVVATYYHRGHIFRWAQLDSDGDGSNELLFYGHNNMLLQVVESIPSELVALEYYPAVVFVLDGPVEGQAYPALTWDQVPRATERAYFAIPPFDTDRKPNFTQFTCTEDLRVLISLEDRRRLQFLPGLQPSYFQMTPWDDTWIEIRDETKTFPVYEVVGDELIPLDVPIQ